jgi:hypothetical protein
MEPTDALTRALRRLTVAIWCLCLLIAVMVAFFMWSYLGPVASMVESFETAGPPPASSSPPEAPQFDSDNDFHARPLEDQIQRASVIAITQLRNEGGKHKAVISEILKRAPGTRFYYDVGDEYRMLSHFPRDNCQDCEGQGGVVFFTGNPATMRSSVTYENDRIAAFGDMPLDELRRLAQSPRPPAE